MSELMFNVVDEKNKSGEFRNFSLVDMVIYALSLKNHIDKINNNSENYKILFEKYNIILEYIKILINMRVNVDGNYRRYEAYKGYSDSKGVKTPLCYAIEYNNHDIIKILIDGGAEINTLDGNIRTPLYRSIMLGNNEISELLIDMGADVNSFNEHDYTPLFAAIEAGNNSIIEKLIEKRADVNKISCFETTPLHVAVKKCNVWCVDMLIKNGANVNTVHNCKYSKDYIFGKTDGLRLKDGKTPLHIITSPGGGSLEDKAKIVKMLVDSGADVNAKDYDGQSPYIYPYL